MPVCSASKGTCDSMGDSIMKSKLCWRNQENCPPWPALSWWGHCPHLEMKTLYCFSLAPCLSRNWIPVACDCTSCLTGPEPASPNGPVWALSWQQVGRLLRATVLGHLSGLPDCPGVRCYGSSVCPIRVLEIPHSFPGLTQLPLSLSWLPLGREWGPCDW